MKEHLSILLCQNPYQANLGQGSQSNSETPRRPHSRGHDEPRDRGAARAWRGRHFGHATCPGLSGKHPRCALEAKQSISIVRVNIPLTAFYVAENKQLQNRRNTFLVRESEQRGSTGRRHGQRRSGVPAKAEAGTEHAGTAPVSVFLPKPDTNSQSLQVIHFKLQLQLPFFPCLSIFLKQHLKI